VNGDEDELQDGQQENPEEILELRLVPDEELEADRQAALQQPPAQPSIPVATVIEDVRATSPPPPAPAPAGPRPASKPKSKPVAGVVATVLTLLGWGFACLVLLTALGAVRFHYEGLLILSDGEPPALARFALRLARVVFSVFPLVLVAFAAVTVVPVLLLRSKSWPLYLGGALLAIPLAVTLWVSCDQATAGLDEILSGGMDIPELNEKLKKDPRNVDLLVERGLAHELNDSPDLARADYDAALAVNPKCALALQCRASLREDGGDLPGALADYAAAIKADPRDAEGYAGRGRVLVALGRHKEAFADLAAAIRLDPTDAEHFDNRGNAYNDVGEYEKAVQDYDRAIRLHPEWSGYYNNRANALNNLGRYREAIADYDRALALDAEDEVVYHNRANCYKNQGKYRKALEDYDRALKLDPADGDTHSSRAMTLADVGRAREAVRDYEASIRLDPDNPNNLNNYAWFLATYPEAKWRNGKRAVKLAQEAVSLRRDASYVDTLAAAYAETGQFKYAVKTQKWAISLQDDSLEGDPCFQRLKLYEQRRPYRETIVKMDAN
jgi:tetratricopeptide (TPR) repeat protein